MRGGSRIGSGRKPEKISSKKAKTIEELWSEAESAFRKRMKRNDTLLALLFQARFLKEKVEAEKTMEDYVKEFEPNNKSNTVSRAFLQNSKQDQGDHSSEAEPAPRKSVSKPGESSKDSHS